MPRVPLAALRAISAISFAAVSGTDVSSLIPDANPIATAFPSELNEYEDIMLTILSIILFIAPAGVEPLSVTT